MSNIFQPLFDSPTHVEEGNEQVNRYLTQVAMNRVNDALLAYELAYEWLLEQRFSENNFKSYRSEVTIFLLWAFEVEECSVAEITRRVLMRYVRFCVAPPEELVGYHNVPQFIVCKTTKERMPNPAWRPFRGPRIDGVQAPYQITERALKTKLAILSSFFNFLIEADYTEINPAMVLLKNGRFKAAYGIVDQSPPDEIKAFSELQWSYIVETAEQLATEEPELHERTLFLIALMYSCYLRISEVSARPGFAPVMGLFRRDNHTGVWGFFIPASKGGKSRTVALSNSMLAALKRYRRFLGLTALPTRNDDTPLFVRHRASGRGRDAGLKNANLGIRHLRDEIRALFERTADRLANDGLYEDAQEVRNMTPHAIRHTGISHDINLNQRPLAHVQADAGHDSIDTTSHYLHTTQVERHESAAGKPIDRLEALR
ncbi:tyrosine-type recombinase/integrase [Neptunomonas marina]|uniref:Site-specific integrase n=1 Tax=Neptunomonas marina TaxID=1815562 RepID=A0A437Q8T9_9GAMM|nr:site-specific integrase [Neptunomonas marina]RVU30958.1 site-specific integrase [Neptunomonas marina]